MKRIVLLLLTCTLLPSISACTRVRSLAPDIAKPSSAPATSAVSGPSAQSQHTTPVAVAPYVSRQTAAVLDVTRTAVISRQQTKVVEYTQTAEAQKQTPIPTLTATRALENTAVPQHTAAQIIGLASTAVPTATLTRTLAPRPTTYTVARGDTLYRLALRFHVTIETIAMANGLTYPYDIQAGQILTIPPADEWVSAEVHVVQPGDTLVSIAEVWSVDWRELAGANGIDSPYTIYAGQELVIPITRPANFTPPPLLTPYLCTATPTTTPGIPTLTPTATVVPTWTPHQDWSVYTSESGGFSLHRPDAWALTTDIITVGAAGEVDRHTFRPSGTAGITAKEAGVLVMGSFRADAASLLQFFETNISSFLPGSGQASYISVSWGATEETQLGSEVGRKSLGTMTVRVGEQPATAMEIWLGAVLHGGRNYGVYFKAPQGEWQVTWTAILKVMKDSFHLD